MVVSKTDNEFYQEDAEFPRDHLISTSAATPYDKDAIFIIENGIGRNIVRLSSHKIEDEYLLLPGAQFKVEKRDFKNGKWYIKVKQIGQEHLEIKMTKEMAAIIQEHEKRWEEINALPPEQKKKKLDAIHALERRMQAEAEAGPHNHPH